MAESGLIGWCIWVSFLGMVPGTSNEMRKTTWVCPSNEWY